MTAIRETSWRDWLAVMPGDVVHDRGGRAWSVVRIATEPGSRDGDGALCCWVELDAGGPAGFTGPAGRRVMRVPDATKRVELDEGPGHGVVATAIEALDWATALVSARLGGTVMDTPED